VQYGSSEPNDVGNPHASIWTFDFHSYIIFRVDIRVKISLTFRLRVLNYNFVMIF